jgi:hypothetical protein
MKSGNLNFLEPSGPLRACNGTAVPFYACSINVTCNRTTPCRRDIISNLTLKLSSTFIGNVQFITYYCPQTTPLGHIPIKSMVVIPTHEASELDLLKFLNLFVKQTSETCCLLQKHCLRKLAMLILDVLPCSLVEIHQRFEDNCRIYLQSNFVPDKSPSHPQILQAMHLWCNKSLFQK